MKTAKNIFVKNVYKSWCSLFWSLKQQLMCTISNAINICFERARKSSPWRMLQVLSLRERVYNLKETYAVSQNTSIHEHVFRSAGEIITIFHVVYVFSQRIPFLMDKTYFPSSLFYYLLSFIFYKPGVWYKFAYWLTGFNKFLLQFRVNLHLGTRMAMVK